MCGSVFQGLWLGFCIAAPVGPIGILVLKQALQRGRVAGLASGLGAALADLIYGALAAAGIRIVADYGPMVRMVGGLVLLWLAWRSWRETPSADVAGANATTLLQSTTTTFALTISNPMTILSFAAMVASTGAASPFPFVGGVFLGSMLWWVTLSVTAGWLRGWIGVRGAILNRLAAITLASFGVWAIWGGM